MDTDGGESRQLESGRDDLRGSVVWAATVGGHCAVCRRDEIWSSGAGGSKVRRVLAKDGAKVRFVRNMWRRLGQEREEPPKTDVRSIICKQ